MEQEPSEWNASSMGKKGGKVKSEVKAEQAKQNLLKANAARRPKPCSCDAAQRTGKYEGLHRSHCPIYRRELREKHSP
jgi:hypothetical protein